jgi:hypothetical protein
MADKSRQKKLTGSEIKAQVQRIRKAIEQHKRENKGDNFTGVVATRSELAVSRWSIVADELIGQLRLLP